MKIAKKLDRDELTFLRQFDAETQQKVAGLRDQLDAVNQHYRLGLSAALKSYGFLPAHGPSLELDLKGGIASWDDGRPEAQREPTGEVLPFAKAIEKAPEPEAEPAKKE